MKILKVNIPKNFEDNGIKDIRMERLRDVVLIAGKNGSGKTRLLTKLKQGLGQMPTSSQLEIAVRDFDRFDRQLDSQRGQLESLENKPAFNDKHDLVKQTEIEALRRAIQNAERHTKNARNILDWRLIEITEAEKQYSFVDFVPKNLELKDSSNLGRISLKHSAVSVNGVGIENLPNGTFAKIQYIQDQWYSATHPISEMDEPSRQSAIENYSNLKDSVKAFLNSSLGRDSEDVATLFGFPLGQANLSDGQKVLLQFCIAIYSQRTNFRDLIFFMDEPENHLHSSVIIETIEQISKCVTNGQIWIATHSIPLLAHFDPSSIWYMENGEISYAGNIPEKVLGSLLGDEEEIAKLQDFIGLPAQMALNRFAYECLFEPPVALTGKDDPQMLQIRKQLGNFEKEGKVKILDYGAGKGRLLANIIENVGDNLTIFTDKFDYVALDKFIENKEECEELIKKVYGSSIPRYFNDSNLLLSNHDKESFDIVVMSNVLHEIDPKNWIDLFKENGLISLLLSAEGILLLVEDTLVPTGEMAYQNGFIVLDTPQLKDLFAMKQEEFVFDTEREGRLKCHVIPKKCLMRISDQTRTEALRSLRELAKNKILEVRNAKKDYKNGKIHGYWIQQLANTTLALSELTAD